MLSIISTSTAVLYLSQEKLRDEPTSSLSSLDPGAGGVDSVAGQAAVIGLLLLVNDLLLVYPLTPGAETRIVVSSLSARDAETCIETWFFGQRLHKTYSSPLPSFWPTWLVNLSSRVSNELGGKLKIKHGLRTGLLLPNRYQASDPEALKSRNNLLVGAHVGKRRDRKKLSVFKPEN